MSDALFLLARVLGIDVDAEIVKLVYNKLESARYDAWDRVVEQLVEKLKTGDVSEVDMQELCRIIRLELIFEALNRLLNDDDERPSTIVIKNALKLAEQVEV